MTDQVSRIAVVISERRLFRLTFSKQLRLIDLDLRVIECIDEEISTITLPAGQEGVIVLDGARESADDILQKLLQLLSIQAEAHVLVVFDELYDDAVQTAMDAGALGVAIKSSPPQVLNATVAHVLEGERCRPAPRVTLQREDISAQIRKQLSAREQKLLRAIMGGQSISATARALGMTSDKVVLEMRRLFGIIRGKTF
ncbi:MAG: hypothetical protein AB8B63_02075 [Granulosicoccus sp.]